VLLNSRSGLEKSDSLVHHVVRRVIQIGLFATTWSLVGMATWFLLPKYTVYAFFDMTVGSIYTHVSGPLSWNASVFTEMMLSDDICYAAISHPAAPALGQRKQP
jgi:hypothetical protein